MVVYSVSARPQKGVVAVRNDTTFDHFLCFSADETVKAIKTHQKLFADFTTFRYSIQRYDSGTWWRSQSCDVFHFEENELVFVEKMPPQDLNTQKDRFTKLFHKQLFRR